MKEPDARARDKAQRARDRGRIFGELPNDLRQYFAENDAHCPSCGYGLRGLQDTRCPEVRHAA